MSRDIPSLEELIAKKKAETEVGKPKFLSKKERQQLALQRRQEEVDKLKNNTPTSTNTATGTSHEETAIDSLEIQRKRQREEEVARNLVKLRERNSHGKKFQFDWNLDENTLSNEDSDPLSKYSMPLPTQRSSGTRDDFGFKRQHNDPFDGLHWSKKPLEHMKSRDWRIMKEDFDITIKGQNSVQPLRYWDEANIPRTLIEIIGKLGYTSPTPIQRASIPIAVKQQDIIGIAETGSGKTLAYLLPMLSKLLDLPRLNGYTKADGPYGLILVPTRELAQQIEVELNKFLRFLPEIEIISIVGGKLIEKNILDLQNKTIEIIIATPGRLIDCLERHYLVLNQIQFLVLDECDKMIEMNFGDQVAQITEFISQGKRQNMMFTATMTKDVEDLSRKYVNNAAIVNIGSVSSKEMSINERIDQRFEFFQTNDDSKKIRKLEKILESRKYKPPIIIFINYKETGEYLNKQLIAKKFKVSLIHGSKSQEQRELALKNFKEGTTDILIGTNVASRGIDVNNVSLVINYQMSKKVDDYIHRVGRTGRAGNHGTAITFLCEADDHEVYPGLKKLIVKSGNKVPEEMKKLGEGLQNII